MYDRDPDPEREPGLVATGRLSARLLLPGETWVHRRVQQVSYFDSGLQQMRVSIDFTVPDGELGTHLPVSVLPKWPPLYRLDFRAATGEPLPILTSKQNGIADEQVLIALAESVGAPLDKPAFRQAIRSLARGPETDLYQPFGTFLEGLPDLTDPSQLRIAELAALLTETTFLWYPIDDSAVAGQRTVCKVEYLIAAQESLGLSKRILRALSLDQPPEYVHLWHAGADATFHVDIEAPKPLIVREAEPAYLGLVADRPSTESAADGKDVETRLSQLVDKSGRLAHVYIAGSRPLIVDLGVRFAPDRWGLVGAAFVASFLISLLATAAFLFRDWINQPANLDATVAVLILAPALIGYLVVRSSDHPVARRHLAGVQLLSLFSALIPLAMAVALLRFDEDLCTLTVVWAGMDTASWIVTVVLLVGLVKAGPGPETH